MTHIHSSTSPLTKFLFNPLSISITAMMVTLSLSACGGGSDSGSSQPVSNPPVTSLPDGKGDRPKQPSKPKPNDKPVISDAGGYVLKGDVGETVSVGEPVGFLAVQSQDMDADYYEWQILSSNVNNVQISAPHQPASSFTFLAPGTYTVQFSAQNRNNYNQLTPVDMITYQVEVEAATMPVAKLKVDRAARSEGYISLYFDSGAAINSNDWELRQIAGPDAIISRGKEGAEAKVSLPQTTKDKVLAFEAHLKSNPAVKDTAYVLLRPTNGSTSPYFCESPSSGAYCLPTTPLDHHYAFKTTSPVADIVTDCVMSYKVNDEGVCNLAYLPFIGQVTTDPTIDDIMDRVVVSQDWMGENLELFLRHYDNNNDFKRLLRSTTAIVISDNIKPSFYWGVTGTMYLSADYLWMTPEQRATLTESEDFRSKFIQPFDYLFDFDYEKDNKSVLFTEDYYPSRSSEASRSLEAIALPLAGLLYHELAHANDFVSGDQLKSTDSYSINQLAALAPYDLPSEKLLAEQLEISYPLNNDMLKGLTQVWYGGQTPTAQQLSYSGQQVADAYFAGRATDDYAYFTAQEDVAMMFEEAMMLTRFGVNRYSMVMDTTQDVPTVIRGQKNRITDAAINSRANFVVSEILPEVSLEVSQKLEQMRPTELCPGTTYFDYYNTDCRNINATLPKVMKYRQIMQGQGVDEFGRPQGAPRHQTPQILLPINPQRLP